VIVWILVLQKPTIVWIKEKIMTFDLNTLDPKKVTATPFTGPGTSCEKLPKLIWLKDIWVSSNENNHARLEINLNQVQNLKLWLSQGIDYKCPPPIVRYNPRIINGQAYEYELIAGHHRFEAMRELGYDRWIFWVYELCLDGFSFDDSKVTLQLIEQDGHKPGLTSSIDEATNAICWLITNGSQLVKNDEDSIKNYINTYCSTMHPSKKGSVLSKVMAKVNTYKRVVSFTVDASRSWIKTYTDYPLKRGGEFDHKRNKHVWSLLEGYEYEQLFNAIKKFEETGKESYYICRTDAPSDTKDLSERRQGILDTIDYLEFCLLKVFEFYQENGRFPWGVECFVPQDTETEPKDKPVFLV
jgi:hypothetical protein